MTLYDLVKENSAGKGEETMWASLEAVSKYAEKMKAHDEEAYQKLQRKVYEEMNGQHYNESFATEDVAGIHYTDIEGKPHDGAHWTKDQVETAWVARTFKPCVTGWDKWVAANAMYADLSKAFDDDDVLEAAYLFFFADEDWPSDGKIWAYMKHKG